jgi:hypothetical protein
VRASLVTLQFVQFSSVQFSSVQFSSIQFNFVRVLFIHSRGLQYIPAQFPHSTIPPSLPRSPHRNRPHPCPTPHHGFPTLWNAAGLVSRGLGIVGCPTTVAAQGRSGQSRNGLWNLGYGMDGNNGVGAWLNDM